ncbi:TetR/AcrR family transcriptional regulator [Streptomyces catenulae]|uniref:TetR/AcrR family transcriptional regulator n=1 Tax=Streptomyces catenulae TaxID=66875 RepID=A0ABV2YUW8_9ACTN|nr:TetR/AcrR family transcriptional regulator [Streptomyces catenulae]
MSGPARRPRRRLDQPREQVLAAAMATIAARGLAGLTMAGLGREVGMSSGHILYYFGTKDELLLQTLRWSEEQLGADRRTALARRVPVRARLDALVDLYLPDGPGDPRWTLWLEVWNRTRTADDAARERQLDLELAWHRDLVALLVEGASDGTFRAADAERLATRIRALLDGFATHLVVGLPGTDPATVRGQVAEFLDETLTPA